MDKNAIKKYAVWARRELISRVSQKALQYGITEDNIVPATATSVNGVVLSNEEIKQRKALIERISEKGYQQVMEEVAYTWFNRFSALRFMEVNGYLPSHVRVFTDEDNNFKPQILAEAINLELDGLDMEKVYALKDANNNDALFKYLVIVQCNALNPILPGMFQRISDYTELLFPDNLLRDGSVIQQMIEMIPEEDWKDAIQIIGWLYQFYNIEPKADVFAKKGKVTKEEIPAATQLFTPDWIVRYMVENSLGRLWIEGHPSADLKSEWKYYLNETEQDDDVQIQLTNIRKEYASRTPEQIKCIDPCSGSGHILAYMFDVLMQIYEAYGYTAREAVRSIVENNIYGLDIDERAAQLAYFSVMMKARQYDRRFLTRKDEDDNPDVPQPHVYAIVESNSIDRFSLDYFTNGDLKLKSAMNSIIREMHDAKEYGSILNISMVDFEALYARFGEVVEDISISREVVLNDILPLVKVAQLLAQKYDVTITNPPYMPLSSMEAKVNAYARDNYPASKTDLYSIFIERCSQMLVNNGMQSMITMHSWMTLGSFEDLRKNMLCSNFINMAHLGTRAFEEIGGEIVQTTAWVQRNTTVDNYKSVFVKLTEYPSQDEKENGFFDVDNHFVATRDKFDYIPGAPYSYWASDKVLDLYRNARYLADEFTFRRGISTGDNPRFLRLWQEIDVNNSTIFGTNQSKWFRYNKGGSFCKWYGNRDYVALWANDGADMKAYKGSAVRNVGQQLKKCISYSSVSTGKPSFRVYDGFLNDQAGNFLTQNAESIFSFTYVLALLNSVVSEHLIRVKNTTQNITADALDAIPILACSDEVTKKVTELTENLVALAKEYWDSFECSWDFKKHPLVPSAQEWKEQLASQFAEGRSKKFSRLSWHFEQWENECQSRFETMKQSEEEINRIFIELYGLQDELNEKVDAKDVSVSLADKKRDIKSLISYAVGCMFGRYSLDFEGLAFAGGDWDDSKYNTFKADKDSIIPICDDEYFSDDIVGRFIRFIEVVYGKETLDENLRFIADALGGSGQPKEILRKYFMDEFFVDHCVMYSGNIGKRPIYWLFDSGKKGGFRALVYMHRYQPDTIARMRTDYVHEQQARYRTAIADLEQRIASASTSERVKLNKRLKTLQDQATEIQGYEEKIHHLADQYISIDLDDGVKKNYDIFKDVLAKIK